MRVTDGGDAGVKRANYQDQSRRTTIKLGPINVPITLNVAFTGAVGLMACVVALVVLRPWPLQVSPAQPPTVVVVSPATAPAPATGAVPPSPASVSQPPRASTSVASAPPGTGAGIPASSDAPDRNTAQGTGAPLPAAGAVPSTSDADVDMASGYYDGFIDVRGVGRAYAGAPPGSAVAYASARDAAETDAKSRLLDLRTAEIQRLVQVSNYQANTTVSLSQRGTVPPGRTVSIESPTSFEARRASDVVLVARFPVFGASGVLGVALTEMAAHLRAAEAGARRSAPPAAQMGDGDGLMVELPDGYQSGPLPRIFTRSGALVYGVTDVDPAVLDGRGTVLFGRTGAACEAGLARLGSARPLRVRGYLRSGSDLAVTEEDGDRIAAADRLGRFFAGARVCLVVPSHR